MRTVTTYYKGDFKSQFSSVKHTSGIASVSINNISLEPRYYLHSAQEITFDEYSTATSFHNLSYLHQQGEFAVEIYPLNNQSAESSQVCHVKEIIILLDHPFPESKKITEDGIVNDHFQNYLKVNRNEHAFKPPFYFSNASTHGIITGTAYIKRVQEFNEHNVDVTNITLINKHELNSGCLPSILTGGTSANSGCLPMLTGGVFGSSPVAGGCLPLSRRGAGCGCLTLFGLLGLLFYLFNMPSCGTNDQESSMQEVLHDTVYVEVYKEKVDTLTIMKTDTVTYVDSTTKTSYEMVSLPNVQFYTNSDVLLPSSVGDLQQLAEYLIKTDSLTATIFGHTDNKGNADFNLKLSQKRAESVSKFLTSLGVNASRIKSVGKGDTEPKGDNNSEEGRLMNRRVEVKLTQTEISNTTRTQVENDGHE